MSDMYKVGMFIGVVVLDTTWQVGQQAQLMLSMSY